VAPAPSTAATVTATDSKGAAVYGVGELVDSLWESRNGDSAWYTARILRCIDGLYNVLFEDGLVANDVRPVKIRPRVLGTPSGQPKYQSPATQSAWLELIQAEAAMFALKKAVQALITYVGPQLAAGQHLWIHDPAAYPLTFSRHRIGQIATADTRSVIAAIPDPVPLTADLTAPVPTTAPAPDSVNKIVALWHVEKSIERVPSFADALADKAIDDIAMVRALYNIISETRSPILVL
jgi:hypothetical protein